MAIDSINFDSSVSDIYAENYDIVAEEKIVVTGQKCYACFVKIVVVEGYTFHTAKYPDGTAVVTCLDGDLKGYQKIAFTGGFTENYEAEWHQNYFVHHYQYGNVYSYTDSQILEITEVH